MLCLPPIRLLLTAALIFCVGALIQAVLSLMRPHACSTEYYDPSPQGGGLGRRANGSLV